MEHIHPPRNNLHNEQNTIHNDNEHTAEHFCASERLRRKYKNEFKRRRKLDDVANNNGDDGNSQSENDHSDIEANKIRNKRWLPEEVRRLVYFSSDSDIRTPKIKNPIDMIMEHIF